MSTFASFSSIKNTGDRNVTPEVTRMSPQDRVKKAQQVVGGRMNVNKMWAKSHLVEIVDNSLSDFGFRVKALLKVPTPGGLPCSLSYLEIAAAMSCSERQAMRAVASLEKRGDVVVVRKHNCRNVYKIVEPDGTEMVNPRAAITKAEKPKRVGGVTATTRRAASSASLTRSEIAELLA